MIKRTKKLVAAVANPIMRPTMTVQQNGACFAMMIIAFQCVCFVRAEFALGSTTNPSFYFVTNVMTNIIFIAWIHLSTLFPKMTRNGFVLAVSHLLRQNQRQDEAQNYRQRHCQHQRRVIKPRLPFLENAGGVDGLGSEEDLQKHLSSIFPRKSEERVYRPRQK